jgi:hypothetical protein
VSAELVGGLVGAVGMLGGAIAGVIFWARWRLSQVAAENLVLKLAAAEDQRERANRAAAVAEEGCRGRDDIMEKLVARARARGVELAGLGLQLELDEASRALGTPLPADRASSPVTGDPGRDPGRR